MNIIQLIYIADVYCPWCYAFGPTMKRIADEYSEFSVKTYGGNLISQPENLKTLGREDPGMAQFWQEVAQSTGRDLSGALGALASGDNIRLYSPGADMILQALKKLAPGHELEHLLILEDMFYAQGQDLFSQAAVDQLADRWKIDAKALEDAINSPEIGQAVNQELAESVKLMGEQTSYPTVMLRRGDKVDAVSRGYVEYETVKQRMEDVMKDLGIDASKDDKYTLHGARAFRGMKK